LLYIQRHVFVKYGLKIICGITYFYMRHYQRNIRTSLSLHEYFRKGQKKITGVFQCCEHTIGNIINEKIDNLLGNSSNFNFPQDYVHLIVSNLKHVSCFLLHSILSYYHPDLFLTIIPSPYQPNQS
jgi:hypothetical protein